MILDELEKKLIKLENIVGWTPTKCYRMKDYELCVKIEYVNPSGSHKDRIAVNMIKGLIKERKLSPKDCLAEISSGNTATAVAWVSNFLGLKSVLYTTGVALESRKKMIKFLGSELIELPIDYNREEVLEDANSRGCIILNQDSNEYNALAHYEGTGKELVIQLNGEIDGFVMGVGTGGTIIGVGKRLKKDLGGVKIIAVTPKGSPVAGGQGSTEIIPGLAMNSVPEIFLSNRNIIDDVIEVTRYEAEKGIISLFKSTGIIAGLSTGASFAAISKAINKGIIEKDTRIAIVAADSVSGYI